MSSPYDRSRKSLVPSIPKPVQYGCNRAFNPFRYRDGAQMVKIVYNTCYGGFGLSPRAIKRYAELKGIDPVQELRDLANGPYAQLKIIDIEAGTKYRIEEYDGLEEIETDTSVKWDIA